MPKATMADKIQLLDLRWQARNQVQIEIINRLLGTSSYTEELQALAEQLADARVELDRLQTELAEAERKLSVR